MDNTPKWTFYLFYIIITTFAFLYILFPSEAAKKYIAYNLKKSNPDLSININNVKPTFPPGLQLKGVSLFHLKDLLFGSEDIKVKPALISFFKPPVTFVYKGRGYQGTFNGDLYLKGNVPQTQFVVDFRMNHIQISEIPAVHWLSDYKISGFLNGKSTFDSSKGETGILDAKLQLSEGKIKLLASKYNIETLNFQNIEGDVEINMPKINIKRSQINGEQVSGSITGELIINAPFSQSGLNISGTVIPHASFLKELSKVFPVESFLSKKSGGMGFSFKIEGTLEKPKFSLL
ncbi:MAG: type II secretion system protein GspN [Desulfobacterales bacterium]|nr:type II secretion system protein GspN [Desulfobacterales bacterium]MBF0396707.1 type II secretion system protein GspN [Desulfobacterales bacterium]